MAEIALSYGRVKDLKESYCRKYDFDPRELMRLISENQPDDLDIEEIKQIFQIFHFYPRRDELMLLFKRFGDEDGEISVGQLGALLIGEDGPNANYKSGAPEVK